MTSADDVAVMTSPRADVSRRRPGVWSAWRRVMVRDGAWRHVGVCGVREFLRRIFWRRVGAPMVVRFPQKGRSAEEDLSGTCENTIGARITAATVWQWSRDSE